MLDGMPEPDWISENGEAALYCGDCLDVLAKLPEQSIDAVVTDPPYAIPTQVASGRTITRNVGDMSIVETAFSAHAREWKRVLGEQGRAFVFCDGASYPVVYRATYGRFNLASLVWDKGRIGMGREFRKRHELIVHAWGAGTPVTPPDGNAYADVIECPPVGRDRKHPAEKPVALMQSLLRVCGETILDPFAGSGTTGVACVKTNRQFIGVEINCEYFNTAIDRITKALAERDDNLLAEAAQ